MTLQTAVGVSGQYLTIRKSSADSNTVIVAAAISQTINGESTQTIIGQFTAIDFTSDGSNWIIT